MDRVLQNVKIDEMNLQIGINRNYNIFWKTLRIDG